MRVLVVAGLLAVGVLVYWAGWAWGLPVAGMAGALVLIAVLGELAVYGVEGFSARIGLSRYASSVVVNAMAVLPELFSALALGLRGIGSGDLGLAEIAVLSVLVSASFNFVVVGVVGLMARGISVEKTTLHLELPLLRVSIASTFLLAAYAIIEAGFGGVAAVEAPYALLVAPVVFWAYYLAAVTRSGLGGARGEPRRWWHLALAAGVLGMVAAAEGLASSVEAMIHLLRVEHIGEAALAVGIASSTPEAVLAILSASRGYAREAAGGLIAATTTSLLLVYPLAYLPLAASLPLDSFAAYMLVVLSVMLWVTKRSLAHENMLDPSESLYILVLSATGLAVLTAVK